MRRHSESTPPADDDFDGPSKTQVKKEMLELQDLGLALLELPQAQLDELEMDEGLRDALADLRRITAHGARRRQVQFVGKLLRRADIAPLRKTLAVWRAHQARDTAALHEIEEWRARMIADDAGLRAWIEAHPASDTPYLRALVRDARRERSHGHAFRELFKYLRGVLQPG